MVDQKFIVLEAHFNGDEYEAFKTGWTLYGAYESHDEACKKQVKLQKLQKSTWQDVLPGVVNMLSAKVVELEEASTLHLVWDIKADKPYMDNENSPYGDFLVYGASRLEADKLALTCIDRNVKGELEKISSRPVELQQLIDDEKGLRFVKKTTTISINAKTGATAMESLNELLISPLYEIRKLTPSEIMEMEKGLDHELEI